MAKEMQAEFAPHHTQADLALSRAYSPNQRPPEKITRVGVC